VDEIYTIYILNYFWKNLDQSVYRTIGSRSHAPETLEPLPSSQLSALFLHKNYMQKNNHNDQSETIPPIGFQRKQGACPHWCSSSSSCPLVKNGLFMPLEQHVAAYCLSTYYPSCSQYQLQTGAVDREQTDPINRRLSIRVPCRHSFHFSEIIGHDHLPGLHEDNTWTIDLSDHGIRFASRHLLPLDTDIRFFLETDDRIDKIEGTGRVVWCTPLDNTALFHAGIVFTDRPNPECLAFDKGH